MTDRTAEERRLRRIIRKAVRDLKRATTFSYNIHNLRDLNVKLEKVCDRVGHVIDDLEALP